MVQLPNSFYCVVVVVVVVSVYCWVLFFFLMFIYSLFRESVSKGGGKDRERENPKQA